MSAKTKKSPISDDKVISFYMDYVLENETRPKSIYKFCKAHNLKEEEFYKHFGSFEILRRSIWNRFYENTSKTLTKNKDFTAYSNKEKMLAFFFTFFELLTMNRSYVLFTLNESDNKMENLGQLKELRKAIKNFAAGLVENANEEKTLRLTKQSPAIFSEGAWVQFLFLLRFWMNDSSPGFEKTDLAIEKSVTTIFEVFDNTPLDSIVDFGKFLYKETFA